MYFQPQRIIEVSLSGARETNVSSVAQVSRPRAIILDNTRPTAEEKTRGRERIHPLHTARRVNWFIPQYWSMITEVANGPIHHHTRSPTEMLKALWRCSSEFEHLSTQVLSSFFEKDAHGKRQFSPWALIRAAENNIYAPSKATRRGILVCSQLILCYRILMLRGRRRTQSLWTTLNPH